MTRAGSHISPDRLDEAIGWHIRLGAPQASDAVWVEFTAWLEADPANRLAYDRVEDLDLELGALAENFRGQDTAPNLVSFERKPRPAIASRIWIAGAALLAASLILIVTFQPNGPAPVTYATRTGETRVVTLADGTRIDINTATKILVQMDGATRHITLDHGEALFHVAKDAQHPFMVTVGDRNVRDIGTVFNILRSDGTITVIVAEGRVGVSPSGKAVHLQEIALEAGDQLTHAEASGATTVERVDPSQALAWRQGYLIYRNAPLSKVVSDLNRYFPSPIALLGKDVSAQRFSGVLRVDNEGAVLKRISQLLPVTVEYGPGGKIGLRASAARP